MSEDRTQPPSKRRRQLAREQGQVAHSPELTSAVGWLAAVVVLGATSDRLVTELIELTSARLTERLPDTVDPVKVATHLRELLMGLAWPLTAILVAFAAGAMLAHQAQVRGLWMPGRIVPDPSRLWSLSRSSGLRFEAERTGWALIKSCVLIVGAAWAIRAGWSDIECACGLEGAALARVAGGLVLFMARVLAGLLMSLGLIDYALRYRRFESMLRTTPEQQREDRRVVEGDIAARTQRRQIARSWRGDSPELLVGASLMLSGPGGLTLILAGGPPPRRITIRAAVRGNQGSRLRRSAEAHQVPHVDAPLLARRLAQLASTRSAITADLLADLASIWPTA